MRFDQLYHSVKPSLSFEVFPPKNEQAEDRLRRAIPRLVALKPDLMTVTYGAMGTTRERTLETATALQQGFQMPTACHLTCVGSTRAELDGLLARIDAAGIRNIVALRGDLPKAEDGTPIQPPADGCRYASELVAHIHDYERRTGCAPFGIAVAGYPEKHIEAPDAATDLAHLRRKVEAGAHSIVTQLFFENEVYFRFVDRARMAGIGVPIIPGLMPIVSARQIRVFTQMCGASIPPALARELDAAGDDEVAAVAVGVRHCVAQAREMIRRGVPGLHFYVMNRADHMERIMAELRDLL